MLTDRGRRISVCNGSLEYSNLKFRRDNGYGFVDRSRSSVLRILRISSPISSPPSSTSSSSLNFSYFTGASYIEHRVSKFDTLAGIAIKYGVEVADITKLNGLVTDLQMFALKSLRIPLPGRHPPSPCLSNDSLKHGDECSEQASSPASNGNHQNILDSFKSLRLKPPEKKVSPAMNYLQGYYGTRRASESFEESSHLENNNQYLTPFPATNTPLTHHRKSKSYVDAIIAQVNQSSNPTNPKESSDHKPMKRRQKSEVDFSSQAPELLLKKNRTRSCRFSAITGNGLAVRSKTVPVEDRLVRKSCSVSSIQEPDYNDSWLSSKWKLKPEFITQSIFDGLHKPLTCRRNKKAVD